MNWVHRYWRVACATAIVVTAWDRPSLRAEAPQAIGVFEARGDVGTLRLPSAAEAVSTTEYRITASGKDIWKNDDEFHFVWRKAQGDVTLTADVEFVGTGKVPHRKACLMVRQGLEPNAPYADVAVHGDGEIGLQYRRLPGGKSYDVMSPILGPVTVKLERTGDVFSMSVARPGGDFQPAGAVSVPLTDPVFIGLAVSSHEVDTNETAIFKNVAVEIDAAASDAPRVRECSLEILTVETGERRVLYRDRSVTEAPNWSRDGRTLYFNSAGRIYVIPVAGGKPTQLEIGSISGCNNDHGLSPDGKWLAVSHNTTVHGVRGISRISIVPSGGGEPRLITPDWSAYWHGWSPDGATLAYAGGPKENGDVFTIPVEGGSPTQLTTTPGLDDGPDYSPDGKYIYWNSERTGPMRIWRMQVDGSRQEQVTHDDAYADWFPHPSPDGQWLVWLSYDTSVEGHPPSKDVVLRIMPLAGGETRVLAAFFGGQGTINVPSWSPDSQYIAFVSYREVHE